MNVIYAIALTTYRESIRSKILYSTLFFAVMLIAVASLFGMVTIGDQVRVIKDFGLFAISLATIAYAVISGSALLQKELAKKTVYNILAKPVERSEFLIGKFLGMVFTSTTLLALMAAGLSVYVALFEGRFDLLLLQAYLLMWLEVVLVCAAAIFFSAIVVTPLLNGLFTLGFFVAGRSVPFILYFVEEAKVSGLGAYVIEAFYWGLPHLHRFNVANDVVYGDVVSLDKMALLGIYGFSYATILLLIATVVFRRREFN